MNTIDEINDLLAYIDGGKPDAYNVLYLSAASALSELVKSWTEEAHDVTDIQLSNWSKLVRRICKRLNGKGYTVEYEAGRLCGIVEVFEQLFSQEQQSLSIDAALKDLLRRGKPSSKLILHILYEARNDHDWVSNAELREKASQTETGLSNIMKRLVQARAVDFVKEGRTIKYRLSPAGIRYYEKNLSITMSNPVARELTSIKEIALRSCEETRALKEQVRQQNKHFNCLTNLIPNIGFKNWSKEQNNFDPLSFTDYSFHAKAVSNDDTTNSNTANNHPIVWQVKYTGVE